MTIIIVINKLFVVGINGPMKGTMPAILNMSKLPGKIIKPIQLSSNDGLTF